ncbi:hypothetical protein H0H87_004758 [Tephrocybe sp. NHM501043]|nr:hypothetical protein H0H87_004758 [Tephrocybe sp. NHM501043]
MFTVLLFQLLITFSVPAASSLYFLSTSQAGGVRFGMWGWCLREDGVCLQPQLGYTWEPQISVSITGALVFFPIGTILTFFTLVSLVPILIGWASEKAKRVFFAFVISSFLASLVAFIFMIAMWNVARLRFHRAGFEANFGPLVRDLMDLKNVLAYQSLPAALVISSCYPDAIRSGVDFSSFDISS